MVWLLIAFPGFFVAFLAHPSLQHLNLSSSHHSQFLLPPHHGTCMKSDFLEHVIFSTQGLTVSFVFHFLHAGLAPPQPPRFSVDVTFLSVLPHLCIFTSDVLICPFDCTYSTALEFLVRSPISLTVSTVLWGPGPCPPPCYRVSCVWYIAGARITFAELNCPVEETSRARCWTVQSFVFLLRLFHLCILFSQLLWKC